MIKRLHETGLYGKRRKNIHRKETYVEQGYTPGGEYLWKGGYT